ncbi:MAG: PIN domain-containing protein [Patescibacteria group bacterium]|jgi:predicted nucleic-acid-binding protein
MEKKKKKLLDTNVVVRFLAEDNPLLAQKAKRIFLEAQENELVIPDFVLTEIVWVLLSFYQLDKKTVIEKLEAMLAFDKFSLHRKVLRQAIDLWRNENISFVDAYLLSLSFNQKRKLYSFDKRLKKLAGEKLLSQKHTSKKNEEA